MFGVEITVALRQGAWLSDARTGVCCEAAGMGVYSGDGCFTSGFGCCGFGCGGRFLTLGKPTAELSSGCGCCGATDEPFGAVPSIVGTRHGATVGVTTEVPGGGGGRGGG